ncbi:MAG: hypothetical protein ACQGVK_07135 [Myxococcota bacterium]
MRDRPGFPIIRVTMSTAHARDFVMTGAPRSGTTYLSAVLYRPPQVVTLSDPGGVWKRFYREHGASPEIFGVFADFRRRIAAGKPVPVLAGTEGMAGRGRVDTWNQKKVEQSVDVAPDFALGMKNPEVFLAHLPIFLEAGLPCLVCVRHPVSVISSWVARKRRRGKPMKGFSDGEAVTFRSTAGDAAGRRIELHNHFCRQILAVRDHPRLKLVRYGEWFDRPGLLDEICDFVGLESPGRLEPAPIPPSSIVLDAGEQDRILAECRIAGELGYPLDGDRLRPPGGSEAVPTGAPASGASGGAR